MYVYTERFQGMQEARKHKISKLKAEWVWEIGVATETAQFVALVGRVERFEDNRSQFFADFYGSLVLTTRSDA